MTPIFHSNTNINELLKSAVPHQKTIVGILAVVDRYGMDATPLLNGLANELPIRYGKDIRYFSDQIRGGLDPVDALNAVPRMLPATNRLAIELSRATKTLDVFYDRVNDRGPDTNDELSGSDDSFSAKNMRLWFRVFVMLSIMTFVFMKILPEFRMMLSEFDVELSGPFLLLLRLEDGFLAMAAGFPLFLLILLPFFWPAAMRYLRRWSPLVWRRRYVSPPVQRRQCLALIAETQTPMDKAIDQIKNNSELNHSFKRISKFEQSLKMGENQWDALANAKMISAADASALSLAQGSETQAWLLRWSALHHQLHRETRIAIVNRTMLALVNIGLGLMVLLLAVTVFTTLLDIMAQLSQ